MDDPAFRDALAAGPADPLLILFTSGSSAQPKPIEKHLRQLETEALTRLQLELGDELASAA